MSEYKCSVRKGKNGAIAFRCDRASWWPEELEYEEQKQERETDTNDGGKEDAPLTLDEWIDWLKLDNEPLCLFKEDREELQEMLRELKERRQAEQWVKVRGYYQSRYSR